MPNTNIIELNGKRYDALSGKFLGNSTPFAAKSRAVNPAGKHHAGKAIDGVLRAPGSPIASMQKPVPPKTTSVSSSAPARPIMDISRAAPHHTAAHQPQHSKTLVRHAVHKPDISLKRQVKAQTRTDILARQPAALVAPKLSYNSVSKQRQEHAKDTPKSTLISKFAPASAIATRPSAAYAVATPVRTPVRPTTQAASHRHQPAMDIFEQAILSAKSHEQTPVKLPRKARRGKHQARTLSIVAISLVVVGLAGFFAYQNKASLEVRIASMRAGFHVALPNYKSAGFSFNSVHANPGIANVSFKSPSSTNNFTITQKQSNWDSQSLLNNFVATTANSYKTYQSGGRTIYVFGSNATWVDNGVWYQLTGNDLSSAQLVKLASST